MSVGCLQFVEIQMAKQLMDAARTSIIRPLQRVSQVSYPAFYAINHSFECITIGMDRYGNGLHAGINQGSENVLIMRGHTHWTATQVGIRTLNHQ